MIKRNGGFTIIDLTSNVYEQALKCLKLKGDKVITIFDGNDLYYANGIKEVDGDIIINTSNIQYAINKDGVTSTKDISDLTALTTSQCNALNVGVIINKKTSNQYHSYRVSYKEDKVGMCLTYVDASVVETISYDYTGGKWVYNSTDTTSLGN